MARHLGIHKETIRVYLERLYAKCGVMGRMELLALLMRVVQQIVKK